MEAESDFSYCGACSLQGKPQATLLPLIQYRRLLDPLYVVSDSLVLLLFKIKASNILQIIRPLRGMVASEGSERFNDSSIRSTMVIL